MTTHTEVTDRQIEQATKVCDDALAFVAYCEARESGKSHIYAMNVAMKTQAGK